MSGKKFLYQILLFILYCKECRFYNFSNINLSNEHIPYYFNAFPDVAAICKEDQTCPYKVGIFIYVLICHLDLVLKIIFILDVTYIFKFIFPLSSLL